MKTPGARLAATIVAVITAGACFTNAAAQTVIDEWESAKLPPPPALKPAITLAEFFDTKYYPPR